MTLNLYITKHAGMRQPSCRPLHILTVPPLGCCIGTHRTFHIMQTPVSITVISTFSALTALNQIGAIVVYWRQMGCSKVNRCVMFVAVIFILLGVIIWSVVVTAKMDGQEAVALCGVSTLLGLSTQVSPRLPRLCYLF